MNTLVIYDSQFGNTELIAQAIANALSQSGQARATRVNQARPEQLGDVNLLIIGSPIQGWKHTAAMQTFLDHIPLNSLSGVKVACFDTRMHMPRWFTGDAGGRIDKALRALGATPLAPPEGFYVKAKEGPLDSGEEERAAQWAMKLHDKYEAAEPRPAA